MLIFCFAPLVINAQKIDSAGFTGQLDYSKFEGLFTYALIENRAFYMPIRPTEIGFSDIVWKKSLEKTSIPILHYGGGSEIRKPYAWDKDTLNLYTVDYFASNSGQMNTYISYRPFERLDSIEIKKLPPDMEISKKLKWVNPMSDYYMSFFKKLPFPSKSEVEKMYETLDFDIYSPVPNIVRLYLRDKCVFYIWEFHISDNYSTNQWTEVATYTSPNVDTLYRPLKYSNSYSGTRTSYNAVADSLFFEGHFKVIIQNNESYVINREHGKIYHLGKDSINLIGTVDFTNKYSVIRGQRFFIEDRDSNEIIFFAPVKWNSTPYPKPNVRIMDNIELKDKFKFILE